MNRSQRAEAAVIGIPASFALVGGFASFFMPVFLRDSLDFSGLAIGLLYGALSLSPASPAPCRWGPRTTAWALARPCSPWGCCSPGWVRWS